MRPAGNRRRSRRVLLIITLVAVTLVTIDSTGVFEPVRNVATDTISPLTGALGWVATPFRNAWAGLTGYDDLRDENRRLRERLAGDKGEQIADANYREQLERLMKQLNIGFVGEIPTQVARVASGPRNNFEDNRVEIDKGSSSGLKVGMPVVTRDGLVGRLERVSSERSVVQLASDPAFVIGVRIAQTQNLGIGRGTGAGKPFVVERGLEIGDKVKAGNFVVTSGLTRSIMPPDIPVGVVSEVVPDQAERSLVLHVKFTAEISQLDVVQVMKWTPPS